MRSTTSLLCILAILTAGSAQAYEKKPDFANAVPSKSLGQSVTGTLSASSATYDRIYNAGEVDAQCGAPALDSANNGMYFDVYCLQVDDHNPIELVLDATGTNLTDTVLTLYCTQFDPARPELNVVAFDDDGGQGTLSAFTAADNIRLFEGQEYWLVISSFGARMTGSYVLQKSSNVFDCGIVANQGSSWGSLKGMYR
jgi:hypothetical protein